MTDSEDNTVHQMHQDVAKTAWSFAVDHLIKTGKIHEDPVMDLEMYGQRYKVSLMSPITDDVKVDENIFLNIGRKKQKFFTLKKLGYGARANVYLLKAQDERLHALKVAYDQSKDALLNEYLAGIRFDHPHIMHIEKGFKPKIQQQKLLMEYVEGVSLLDLLTLGIDYPLAYKIIGQFLDAIVHMVERGVLPWDLLVLHNNLINEKGDLKIIDFGSYYICQKENGNYDETVCSNFLSIDWCIFRGVIGDTLGTIMQILASHKDRLVGTLFYEMLYDRSIWRPNIRPAPYLFPRLQDGTSIHVMATSKIKHEHCIYYLKELQNAFKMTDLPER